MIGTSKSIWGFDPRSIPGCTLWLDGADNASMNSTSAVTVWNDKSGQSNTMTGTGTWSGGTMVFNGTTNAFSNLAYAFPFGAYSMFAVYSNTTAPAASAYMNAVYGSNGYPMLGTFGPTRDVSARSVVANTGALGGTVPVGWAARISSAQADRGYGIATDPSGNVFVTGSYDAALTLFNSIGVSNAALAYTGGTDVFIAKYSSAGAVLWAARIAGTATSGDIGYGIAADPSGNVFVTGQYSAALTVYDSSGASNASLAYTGSNDVFIAKYSSAGAVLWAARIAGTTTSGDIGYGIAADPSGNVFVTGSYGAALTVYDSSGVSNASLAYTGGTDVFIAKYSSAGAVLWAARITGTTTAADTGYGIATDPSGNVFVTGQYAAALTLFNSSAVSNASLPFAGSADCFVAKYSTAGAVLWAARIAGTGSDSGLAIATDTSGNVVVTGMYITAALTVYDSSGVSNATLAAPVAAFEGFIVKYTAAGAVLWAARLAGASSEVGRGISTDPSGDVIVTGNFGTTMTLYNANGTVGATLNGSGTGSCFLVKYSSSGTVVWGAAIYGGTSCVAVGNAIATDSSGNLFITGYYATTALFLSDTAGSFGANIPLPNGTDAFIAKYSSIGYITSNAPTRASSNVLVSATYTPSTFSPFVNGFAQTTLAGTTLTTTGLFLGGPSNYFNGTISEVLIYGTTLTATQRQSVEGYLSRKWGIGNRLITTHPFYTIPPFNRYFNPNDIPGCSLWLDGADGSSLVTGFPSAANSGVVTTLAGSGSEAFADGTGAAASFANPEGVAVLPNGNIVVADLTNHRIRLVTPLGVVTTLAGSGSGGYADGTGAAASFRGPWGVAVLPNGNIVVADWLNNRIRLVTTSTYAANSGVVTTLAGNGDGAWVDGTGASASFSRPQGVAVIPSTGVIVVADAGNFRIRLVTQAGVVTTLSDYLEFNQPAGVAVIPSNEIIVVADTNNHRICLVTPAGVVTTLAGSGSIGSADGTGAAASFYYPYGVAVIPSSGLIVVADHYNHRIRLVWTSTYAANSGVVTTLAGSIQTFANGTGAAAGFNFPYGVAVIPSSSEIVVGDTLNNRIRRITVNLLPGPIGWNDKSGLNNTMMGTATWTGSNMSFNGSTQAFSNTTYVFPISNYSMFSVYSNTTAPAAGAYMNAVYGSNGFPMLGTFGSSKFVSARSVVANTGALGVSVGWAARITGTGTDKGSGIATDSSGHVYVTGNYTAAVNVNNGNGTTFGSLALAGVGDVFIAKYSPDGFVVWALRIAGTGYDEGGGIATDSNGNVLVTGYYGAALTLFNASGVSNAALPFSGGTYEGFFAKYSSAGACLWAARVRCGNFAIANGVATDSNGDVFVSGYYNAAATLFNASGVSNAALSFTAGGFNTFVAKYTSVGAVSWAARIVGTNTTINFIATDTSGNVIVTGNYSGTLSVSNASGVNSATLSLSGANDTFVVKYTSAGAVSWAARIATTAANVVGLGVTTDSSGDIFVSGYYDSTIILYNSSGASNAALTAGGNYDCFIAKYSAAGAVLWTAKISGGGYDNGSAIRTDLFGNVFVTGVHSGATVFNSSGASVATLTSAGGQDCFVVKYSSAGAVLWATRISGTGIDNGSALATDSTGNVFVTGIFTAAVTLSNSDGTSGATFVAPSPANNYDVFIVKYDSNGFINAPVPASSNVLVSATYTPSTFSPFINGTATSTTLAGSTLATTGIFVGGPSNYFNGTISELLIYSSNLSAAQRQQVEGYLIQKWGLSAQTLSNHQYKLIPPATSQPPQFAEVTPGNWVRDWQPELRSLAAANASGVTLTGSNITGGATYTANGWFGGVLGPDGNIYFSPFAATNILRLNVTTGVTTNITGGATYTANGWRGGVLGPDGNIYFTPFAATNILRLNVASGVTTNITGGATYTANGWSGGALGPDGNIYFMPFAATNILRLNVATGVTTNITGGATYTASGWGGAILGPDGNIYGTPYNAANILRLNVATGVTTNITGGATYTTSGWQGQTLGQDGNIYFAPTLATNVIRFNVATGVTTNITGGATLSANATRQCVLGPDGNIYFTPHVGSFILQLNVSTGVITSLTPSGITYNGSGGWQGSILGPDGNIYFSPFAASNILKLTFSGLAQLPSSNYCLSAYTNKS